MNVGLRAQKTASAGPAEYFDLFSDDGRPAEEGRPAALLEPRPQEGVQRHVVDYAIEVCPFVQILDVPVPQVGDQLPDTSCTSSARSRLILSRLLKCPSSCLMMSLCEPLVRVTKLAEQLVEVPTKPGYALAVVTSKLFSRRELWGILSGQGSTASGLGVF